MKKQYLFLLLTSLSLLSFGLHKFYLSITQINFVKDQKSLQIVTRVFTDDLEQALNERALIDTLELNTERTPQNIDSLFSDYLQQELKFSVNNTIKEFDYIGSEYSDGMVVFYLEITDIDTIQQLEVSNKILTSTISEQENLVKTKIYKRHKTTLFNLDKTSALINF
ncbi:MAG: DUF6702 family protein [Flavicella sp.]